MRKISEMYQRSGGTACEKRCESCISLVPMEKQKTCIKHGYELTWNPQYIACKFHHEVQEGQQISLNDYMEE